MLGYGHEGHALKCNLIFRNLPDITLVLLWTLFFICCGSFLVWKGLPMCLSPLFRPPA